MTRTYLRGISAAVLLWCLAAGAELRLPDGAVEAVVVYARVTVNAAGRVVSAKTVGIENEEDRELATLLEND